MKFDLVDGGDGLEVGRGEELFQILDGEIGNADVLDAARGREFLKLAPRVTEVPVGVVLLQVRRVG